MVIKTLIPAIIASLFYSGTLAQEPMTTFYAELIKSHDHIEAGDIYDDVESKRTLGFGLGAGVLFGDNTPVAYRLMLGVGYINEVLEFKNPGWSRMERGSIFIKLPAHAIVKLVNESNFGIVIGVTPSLKILGDDDAELKFKPFDLSGDVGFNYNFRTKGFSIRPELKYSLGFINAVVDNSMVYVVDKYLRNRFTLTVLLAR